MNRATMTTRGATCLPPLQPPCVRAPGLLASPSCLPCPRSGQAPFYDKRAAVLGKLGFETGGSVMATVRVTCLQGWGPRPRSMGGGRLVGAGASPLKPAGAPTPHFTVFTARFFMSLKTLNCPFSFILRPSGVCFPNTLLK